MSDIKIFERAIWKETAELSFSDSGGRSVNVADRPASHSAGCRYCTLLEDERVTYIKMDGGRR